MSNEHTRAGGQTADDDRGTNMNIRRFVADNSRAALRQVRDTLGGDAIILANRSIEGGVEVLAAAPEAVDALTRRMTASTPASQPLSQQIATPTELGLKRAVDGAAADAAPATATVVRKRLASLFSRRTQAEATMPTFAEQTASVTPRTTASKAAGSYASFAAELAAVAPHDDALAPDTVALSSLAAPLREPVPVPVVAAPTPVPPVPMTVAPTPVVESPAVAVQPAAVQAPAVQPSSFTAAELSDFVAREVTREVSREFGRDVINDLTRDVSAAVAEDVTREVTREVTRDVTRDVTREIRAMQAMLTEQLSTLTWTDAMRREPARTKLMQDLVLAGFSPSLSRHIQERLPADYGNDEAHAWAETVLRRNLPIASDAEELIDEGGVFALVGPTGVGKTTTVAKLAARFALKHGVDRLALITTDGFRIGAQDQLRIYGKILGATVLSIHDQPSLTSAIEHLKDKKLVLIDTAGLSQRDERVAEQIAMLRGAKAKRLVVLNATADAETLDHVVSTFADREFAGCVITKTDEAARLGPVLDAVIRHRLRIHHVSTGQKVPEDLERPDAAALVRRAMTRAVVRPAFDVRPDDASTWMSAMAVQAQTLPELLHPALDASTPASGASHA